jgi:hypothetical protein
MNQFDAVPGDFKASHFGVVAFQLVPFKQERKVQHEALRNLQGRE